MGELTRDSTGMTPALRWLWVAGAAVVVAGPLGYLLVPDGAVMVVEVGLALLSVASGVTAARGATVGSGWLALAWFVPAFPVLAGVGTFLWLAHENADPLAVVAVFVITTGVAIAAWVVFAIALVVELVRRRRRRFGRPRPAWNNDPTPPSYS